MIVTGPLRDLLSAVATGRDSRPADTPRPGRLMFLRRMLPVATPVVALVLATGAYAELEAYGVGRPETLIVAALSALPLLLLRFNSLLAWRVGIVTTVVSGANKLFEAGNVWPANVVATLIFLLVLAVTGYRQMPGVLVWVWLISASLIWVFIPGTSALGSTLLITLLVVAGHLFRRWGQVRRTLRAEQERGALLTERARIARELHDVVAHHMSLVAVRAETAPYRLAELSAPARAEFSEISRQSREALVEMRRLLGVLRSEGEQPPTAPQPGLGDLDALVASARAAGTPVTVRIEGEVTGASAATDLTAYRILQESLSNAARHAPGAPVEIELRRAGDELVVRVSNGPGRATARAAEHGDHGPREGAGDPVRAPGQGVRGMRERATVLGGELSAQPTPGGGFEVVATLPLGEVRDGLT